MRVVISKTGRFIGRLSIQVVPSVTASVVGGYLLAQLVPQHAAAPATSATPVSQTANGTPVANDRAPIRVVPQVRRDAQASEPPAEVKRAEAKPADKPVEAKVETRQVAAAPAVAPAPEAKVPRVKPAAPAATQQQVYTPEPYTPEADLPQVASQPVLTTAPAPKPAPQVAAPPVVASAPPLPAPTIVGPAGPPTVLSPVVVNAQRPMAQPAQAETVAAAEPAPQPQREHGVFSAISNAAGTAANVTGDTINWVIDLPGKLIGQDNQDNRQQQASQPRRFM